MRKQYYTFCVTEHVNILPHTAPLEYTGPDAPLTACEVCCLPALALPRPQDVPPRGRPKLPPSMPHRKPDSAPRVSQICSIQPVRQAGSDREHTQTILGFKLARADKNIYLRAGWRNVCHYQEQAVEIDGA